MRRSDGVLGKLYREIHSEQAMEAFIRNDYKFSVMLDFQLDQRILSLPLNQSDMHRNLQLVNKEIVIPLTAQIK